MKNYCIISHTHWDREWYLPFEQFRVKLCDLMDNLLDILNKDESWLLSLLREQSLTPRDVFCLTCNDAGRIYIIKNDGSRLQL